MTPESLGTERHQALQAWRKELAAEESRLAEEAEGIAGRLREVRRQAGLLDQLLGTENSRSSVRPGSPDLLGACESILRSAGKPTHISDIRQKLTESGIRIPGQGTDANVIVHLRRAPNVFVRVARGTYALTEWDTATKEDIPQVRARVRRRQRTKRHRE